METRQIKSKDRVRERGEVFTSEREVNAMLDLVKEETERIESRFLEPACGTGNFLAEVLRRKLKACKRYEKSPVEWEKNAFFAVSSIYGIDIMDDNVKECRARLYDIWVKEANRILSTNYTDGRVGVPSPTAVCLTPPPRSARAVAFLLERNILLGNALSLKIVDSRGNDTKTPITFSEWSWAMGNKIQRRDFRLDVLLEKGEAGTENQMTLNLFADSSASDACNWMVDPEDPEGKRQIPAPTKVWPLVDYWMVGEGE